MQSLLRDLRFAVRTLARTPLLTIAVVLTLALGIGANTAVFTVANVVLLRPFPFPSPEQIVSITSGDAAKENSGTLLRYELVRDYNQSFQSVSVWASDNLNLTGSGEPVQVPIIAKLVIHARCSTAVGTGFYAGRGNSSGKASRDPQ